MSFTSLKSKYDINLYNIVFSKYSYNLLVLYYNHYHINENLLFMTDEKEPFTIGSMKKYVRQYFGEIYKMK